MVERHEALQGSRCGANQQLRLVGVIVLVSRWREPAFFIYTQTKMDALCFLFFSNSCEKICGISLYRCLHDNQYTEKSISNFPHWVFAIFPT